MNAQTVRHSRRERIRFLWRRRRFVAAIMLAAAATFFVLYLGEWFGQWQVGNWWIPLWGVVQLTLGIMCLQDWREGVRDMPYVTNPRFAWMSIVVGGLMVLIFILAKVE